MVLAGREKPTVPPRVNLDEAAAYLYSTQIKANPRLTKPSREGKKVQPSGLTRRNRVVRFASPAANGRGKSKRRTARKDPQIEEFFPLKLTAVARSRSFKKWVAGEIR